ncbi:MAG: threonine ammonia-lyase [Nitrospirota bacterium]
MTIREIREASFRIRPFIHKTPLIHSNSFSKMTGADVYLKAENLQKTGSFKVRGAFNKMIGLKGKVIAASMGNHAQAVSFAAGVLGIQSKIVMPLTAPMVKEEAAKGYGASVISLGESFREALDYALDQKDFTFIHAFDDEDIIAGQGTVGMEIVEELSDIDYIMVPVGGGGLISGIAAAVKELSLKTKVVGVQSEAAPSAFHSLKEGRIIEMTPEATIADGIAIGKIGQKTFDVMKKYVEDILLVNEGSIAMAILNFLERKKLVVEGAGAVALAALFANRERFAGRKIVLVISGGNIDFTLIDRIILKGLMKSKRIGIIEVILKDMPGTLNKITEIIAVHRGNILNVYHDRLMGALPIGETRVFLTLEIRGEGHLEEIVVDIKSQGFSVKARG